MSVAFPSARALIGSARSLGLFAQLEPERDRPSVRTLLSPPPAWQALLDPPDSPEYRAYLARLDRVRVEFSRSRRKMRRLRWNKAARSLQSQRMRGNNHRAKSFLSNLNARSQRLARATGGNDIETRSPQLPADPVRSSTL